MDVTKTKPTKTIAIVAGGVVVAALAFLAVIVGHRTGERDAKQIAATFPAITPSTAGEGNPKGYLYGRVTTKSDGATYEGRLRWGADEEALWGHFFNGFKDENPWAAHVPPERLKKRRPVKIFGVEIIQREHEIELGRPFMARFGDIVRIDSLNFNDVQVTLKSGAVFVLDRLSAGDFDDGVRVWDSEQGVVDLKDREIRTIELIPNDQQGGAPYPLHGTVRTRQGEFTGFLQWDREECLGLDELDGRTADGELSLRFDTIRSIARHSKDSSLVTLLDGREIVLSGTREAGDGNRGMYVDDLRYGRVLVSWAAFERVEFSLDGSTPNYDDFPPGHPLTGSVTTREGRRLAGRLVFDLDESETTETLDAPYQGVDYTIPFGLVASIVVNSSDASEASFAALTLHTGEQLQLEHSGDLGEGNAGMLVFVDGHENPEYVPWSDVEKIEFAQPPSTYPPVG